MSDPGSYAEIMEPLAEKFAQLDQMSLDECEEFVEVAEFVLDGLWNSQVPYGQPRMRQLIDAVCMFIKQILIFEYVRFYSNCLSPSNLRANPFQNAYRRFLV